MPNNGENSELDFLQSELQWAHQKLVRYRNEGRSQEREFLLQIEVIEGLLQDFQNGSPSLDALLMQQFSTFKQNTASLAGGWERRSRNHK